MLKFLKAEANRTRTENGAVTNVSTYSDCLDLFATIGAIRNRDNQEVIDRFVRAYTEDKTKALKILFFARDIRGGLGERKVFRTIIKWLADNEPEVMKKNIRHIAEYGRYDDLLCLLDTTCRELALECIAKQLKLDVEAMENGGEISLLGKWLPSVNTSSSEAVRNAKIVARYLHMTDAEYRKTLSALRARIRIIENNLRTRDYSFDYSKQPSKAMLKYRKAFIRNDKERYSAFLDNVSSGEAKLNTQTLMPYEFVEPFIDYHNWNGINNNNFMKAGISPEELKALNTTWRALPDFCDGRNALAVIDTSGSMFWEHNPMPAAIALSLGLYFAERNTGIYRNHFIMFSENPQLIEIKGDSFADRLRYICSFNEVGNTNIEAVFRLVLDAAVKNRVKQDELPEQLVIISDMEFDRCTMNADMSNFENAKRLYAAHGYKLPNLVFWNVCSRNTQQPVTKNEQGVILVSGCTPRLFSMVAKGDTSPYEYMMEIIGSERYARIAA
ncbi:MAG: DUF2828 family protein [Bacteroidaceae bacterium]|nr:DUF2828 family protein [Bacteroidaceae bacterium]